MKNTFVKPKQIGILEYGKKMDKILKKCGNFSVVKTLGKLLEEASKYKIIKEKAK